MAYRKCILRHYDVTFCAIFLKASICLLLMTDYQHTKFRLIRIKKNKLRRGGGIRPPPLTQVENVLNRPGKIGLKAKIPDQCVAFQAWDPIWDAFVHVSS